MKTFLKYILLPLLLLLVMSCQKVIKLKLKNAEERLVIESVLTKGDSIHQLKITKTLNFDQTTDYPTVDDAQVTVTDDLGNVGVYSSLGNGIYQLQNYMVYVGRTYTLKIVQNGNTYEAQSKVPTEVDLVDAFVMPISMGVTQLNYIVPMWTDIAGEKNYYKYDIYKNNKFQPGIHLQDDTYADGLENEQPIDYYDVHSGDTIRIVLNCIDYSTYRYFFTLDQNTGSVAAPANPESNFGNKALGYFSARVSSEKTIIVP